MKTDLLIIPMSARYRDMRAAALAAEDAGFDGLWTWDHLRDPDTESGPGVPEAWTVLTALAEVTRRIALGPLVLNVANRHPGILANMAATLQAVTGGRLLLGIGAGGSRRTPYAAEQQALGLSVERDEIRARRVAEAIELMRRLWSGQSGFLKPEPPPPIIVGGFGPRMAGIAGRHADGFNTQAMHPRLGDLVRLARDEHAAAGRDASRFIVTAFAGLDERWLRPDSRARQTLERVGVERLILLVEPPSDPDELWDQVLHVVRVVVVPELAVHPELDVDIVGVRDLVDRRDAGADWGERVEGLAEPAAGLPRAPALAARRHVDHAGVAEDGVAPVVALYHLGRALDDERQLGLVHEDPRLGELREHDRVAGADHRVRALQKHVERPSLERAVLPVIGDAGQDLARPGQRRAEAGGGRPNRRGPPGPPRQRPAQPVASGGD